MSKAIRQLSWAGSNSLRIAQSQVRALLQSKEGLHIIPASSASMQLYQTLQQ